MYTADINYAERCIGCFSDENVIEIKIQNELLNTLFQANSLKLCYICKKLAQNTEFFIQNVHNNQMLLQNLLGVAGNEIKLKPQPLLKLQSKVINLYYNKSEELFSGHDDVDNSDITVKLENDFEILLDEASTHNLEFNIPLVKEEDILDNLKLEETDDILNNSNLKCHRKVLKKTKKSKKKEEHHCLNDNAYEPSYMIKVQITRDECMKEREVMAKKKIYLDAKYKCDDCLKGFIFKEIYDKHMKLHRKSNGKYECDICKQRVKSAEKLLRHQKYHENRFRCAECGLTRVCRETIRHHYTQVHMKEDCIYPCTLCSREFKSRVALRKHTFYAHKMSRVTCDHCYKTYNNKSYLRRHILLKHTKDKSFGKRLQARKTHVCNECGKKFESPSRLKIHMTRHSKAKTFYCVECNKAFKTEVSLNQHLKRALPHVRYAELPLQCDHCDKRFGIKRDLERHMNRIHLDNKPYQCDRCEKAYVNQWSLIEHVRYTHDGHIKPRKYPCTVCDKVFKTNSTCKMHIRTHTGERPYKCSKCSASFSQSGILNTHVKLVHLKLTRDGRPKSSSNLDRTCYDYSQP